jgi:hypothetical protein
MPAALVSVDELHLAGQQRADGEDALTNTCQQLIRYCAV